MDQRHTKISKFLSYVLRHRPDAAGLTLDTQGWVDIATLLAAAARQGVTMTRDDLEYVVANNNKKRFAVSDCGTRIRASQGHSVDVDLGYEPTEPPDVLYHGTATRNLDSIRASGLVRGNRRHVHLSRDVATALNVGGRHGKPVVLTVRAGEMHGAGHAFFVSANGVWLTEHVAPQFLRLGDEPLVEVDRAD